MVLMDALVCVAPGELELARRPIPVRGDGEALVKPRRIGICGTDYHIFEGKHQFLNYPRVMGHELAVEVLEAPPGSDVAPGEIVVVNPYLSCGTCIACRQGKPNCCVFDATGNTQSIERGFDFVAHGGRYVLVSVVKDPIRFADADFHRKEMTLLGSRNATSTDFARVISALRSGDVPVDKLITSRTTLGDAVHDLPKWATSKAGLIKALIEIE